MRSPTTSLDSIEASDVDGDRRVEIASLRADRWLAPLAGAEGFEELRREAERRRREAREAFVGAGGEELLGAGCAQGA